MVPDLDTVEFHDHYESFMMMNIVPMFLHLNGGNGLMLLLLLLLLWVQMVYNSHFAAVLYDSTSVLLRPCLYFYFFLRCT